MISSTAMTGSYAVAQNGSSSNMSSASVNNASSPTGVMDFNKTMADLESSNNPQDIATLAYIWGYPLISVVRTIDFSTSPNVPAWTRTRSDKHVYQFSKFPYTQFYGHC